MGHHPGRLPYTPIQTFPVTYGPSHGSRSEVPRAGYDRCVGRSRPYSPCLTSYGRSPFLVPPLERVTYTTLRFCTPSIALSRVAPECNSGQPRARSVTCWTPIRDMGAAASGLPYDVYRDRAKGRVTSCHADGGRDRCDRRRGQWAEGSSHVPRVRVADDGVMVSRWGGHALWCPDRHQSDGEELYASRRHRRCAGGRPSRRAWPAASALSPGADGHPIIRPLWSAPGLLARPPGERLFLVDELVLSRSRRPHRAGTTASRVCHGHGPYPAHGSALREPSAALHDRFGSVLRLRLIYARDNRLGEEGTQRRLLRTHRRVELAARRSLAAERIGAAVCRDGGTRHPGDKLPPDSAARHQKSVRQRLQRDEE